jgi:ABC-type dipeptide/oligopeptide/nickel transport system permease subunit
MLSDAVDEVEAFTEKWIPALYPVLVTAVFAVTFSFLVYAGS